MRNIKNIALIPLVTLCFSLTACNINPANNTNINVTQTDNSNSITSTWENSFKTQATSGNADWMADMSEIIAKKSIRDIVIPGTHDSGTHAINEKSDFAPDNPLDSSLATIYSVKDKLNKLFKNQTQDSNFKKFISSWSKTQSTSIYEQLEMGIRYLDLRVLRKSDGQFYIVHGMYSDNLDIVLSDIKRFINAHPKEILILDFNHLFNMKNSHEVLVKKLNDNLVGNDGKSRMIPGNSPLNTAIGDYWKNNTQVIAIYDDQDTVTKHPELWSQNSIFSPWANKQDADELKNSLQDILDGKLFNNTKHNFDCKNPNDCNKISKDRLFVLQGIQTPNAKMLIENFSVFSSLKNAEEDFANSSKNLDRVNKSFDETKKKYDSASFIFKPFYAIQLGGIATDRKIKQSSFNVNQYDLKKAQAKYASSTNNLEQLAGKTTPLIRDLIKNEWSGKDINIVITDWFEKTDIVEVIKSLNRSR